MVERGHSHNHHSSHRNMRNPAGMKKVVRAAVKVFDQNGLTDREKYVSLELVYGSAYRNWFIAPYHYHRDVSPIRKTQSIKLALYMETVLFVNLIFFSLTHSRRRIWTFLPSPLVGPSYSIIKTSNTLGGGEYWIVDVGEISHSPDSIQESFL